LNRNANAPPAAPSPLGNAAVVAAAVVYHGVDTRTFAPADKAVATAAPGPR